MSRESLPVLVLVPGTTGVLEIVGIIAPSRSNAAAVILQILKYYPLFRGEHFAICTRVLPK